MSAFTDAVAANLEGVWFVSVGACKGCATCGLDDLTESCEPCEGSGYDTEKDADCEPCGGEGTLPREPTDEDYDLAGEGGFSWSACDSCGSSLGGDRYPLHGIIAESMEAAQAPDSTIEHWRCCVDCLHYHANGTIPTDGEWAETDGGNG